MIETRSDWAGRFIGSLEELEKSDNRRALAALRRGSGKPPGTVAEMHRYLVPWTSTLRRRDYEDGCYVIASLFALHPQPGGEGNLGASLAHLAEKEQERRGLSKSERPESLERRFTVLLNCHYEDLAGHLRQAISLLRANDVPVEWRQLLKDYWGWEHEDRAVQRRWARAFWGSQRAASGSSGQEETEKPEEVYHEG